MRNITSYKKTEMRGILICKDIPENEKIDSVSKS